MRYFNDLWTLPSPSTSMEATGNPSMAMPLSMAEVPYNIVQQSSANLDLTLPRDLDPFLKPIWAQGSLFTQDPLDLVFHSDEVILEAFTGPDRAWDDLHHRYYFIPKLRRIEVGEFVSIVNGDNYCPDNPLAMHGVYAEGNMESIATTMPLYISKTPRIVENVFIKENCSPEEIRTYTELFKEYCDVFSWSYEEIPGIDLGIVEHEIMTYPDSKSVQKKLRLVNPRDVVAIKAEVEKLLKASFIYLV
jgi:hypothetical protein